MILSVFAGYVTKRMESFAEYRIGHNEIGIKHWVECRGEVIAQVENVGRPGRPSQAVVAHFQDDGQVVVRSEIPGWNFEGRYPSVGHCLVEAARSHRRFVEPSGIKRLGREIALWPLWGKVAAGVIFLGALAETLSFVLPLLLASAN